MSMKSSSVTVVPEDTARVAKAVFKKGNRYLTLRDTFGDLFDAAEFAALFSNEGKPAINPARLALVTVIQFAEQLSDEVMADQVRSRIDLKYLLALPLDDPGFDASVLSEFRTRLVEARAEKLLFEQLLARFRDHKLLRVRGPQRTDSTHVLAAVRALNRVEVVTVTFRNALNALSVAAPDWLTGHLQPEWRERYGYRLEPGPRPRNKAERAQFAQTVGADGLALFRALSAKEAPDWLWQLPAIETLRQVWLQNYAPSVEDTLIFREQDHPPAGRFVSSPFDGDAKLGVKYSTSWVGYKVYLTESCDEDLPHLVTNVESSPATTSDIAVLPEVHRHLELRNLSPERHFVDSGFIAAESLVQAEDQGITLLGRARPNVYRQLSGPERFSIEEFVVDDAQQRVTCPAGKVSQSWSPAHDLDQAVIKVKFSRTDCLPCPLRERCTNDARRSITLRPQRVREALQRRRVEQETPEFIRTTRVREGIEGTISQGVRACGMRRSRYRGLPKTRLQHLAVGSAINLQRVADWLMGVPRELTRQAAFVRLYPTAA